MQLDSPTLASLRFFEAAARHLSFQRAALDLHVTKGAVSQQIKHLERVLDCRLFERRTRALALTDEGRRLAIVVQSALGSIRREAAAIIDQRARSRIRVRICPSLAIRWLVPRLGEFHSTHPQTQLVVNADYGPLDSQGFDFDIAIELSRENRTPLIADWLMNEYLIPVCTPAYLATLAAIKGANELAQVELLHDAEAWIGEAADAEWRFWLDRAGAEQVESARGQYFSLSTLAIEAALADQGMALGHLSWVAELIASGRLVTPVGAPIESSHRYYLLYHRQALDHPGVQSLIAWLKQQAGDGKAPFGMAARGSTV